MNNYLIVSTVIAIIIGSIIGWCISSYMYTEGFADATAPATTPATTPATAPATAQPTAHQFQLRPNGVAAPAKPPAHLTCNYQPSGNCGDPAADRLHRVYRSGAATYCCPYNKDQ